MIASKQVNSNGPYWFVEAKEKNKLDRVLEEGVWEFFESETEEENDRIRYLKHLDSMKLGASIAIKHYGETKGSKLNFPISQLQSGVQTIFIAAIGKIAEVGKIPDTSTNDWRVKIEWREKFKEKERKFHFFRPTDKISSYYSTGDWRHAALIGFAFHNVKQDIDEFLKHEPYTKYAPSREGISSVANGNDGMTSSIGSYPQLNTILYGPPGTGKTYFTKRRCVEICNNSDDSMNMGEADVAGRFRQLLSEGRVEFITFHESFGYEDFVEGLRPNSEAGNSGTLRLVPKPGVLQRIADRARRDADLAHVLVIDEINRANISKVLGELITLLEEDKREGQPNEVAVTLPYSEEKFTLPANLHVIGTMNTADRSVALLDTALRRRFHFEEMPPDSKLLENIDGIDLPNVLDKINERLEWLVDRDHLVGHAWLMKARTKDDVDGIMRRKIIPLIAEYFHEDWNKVQAVLGGGSGFVKRTELQAPPGQWNDGEKRWRWTINDVFKPDAYNELINGGTDNVSAPG